MVGEGEGVQPTVCVNPAEHIKINIKDICCSDRAEIPPYSASNWVPGTVTLYRLNLPSGRGMRSDGCLAAPCITVHPTDSPEHVTFVLIFYKRGPFLQ